MTNLTPAELTEIIEAAKARQDEITPAPWTSFQNRINSDATFVDVIDARNGVLAYANPADANLITAAPDLNAAVIALAARVEELEAQRPIIPAPRIQVYEDKTTHLKGQRWFYSVSIGHVPVSNNHSAPTEAEAYECARKAVEFYLNRLTGKSSEWGGY